MAKKVYNVGKKELKGKNNLVICDVSSIMRTHFHELAEDNKLIKQYRGKDGILKEWRQFVAKVFIDDEVFNTSAMWGLFDKVMLRFGKDVDYIFCFDTPKNLLKVIDKKYKANRVKMGNEYFDQVNTFMMMMKESGFTCLSEDGYEADHMIHLAVEQNKDYYDQLFVVTSDMDLSCLVDEKTTMVNSVKSRGDITRENYEEKVKCQYNSILLKKCLVGDASDKIQGIYRFGEVKFRKFMEENVSSTEEVRGREIEIIEESNLSDDNKKEALYASKLVLPLKLDIDAVANERDLIDMYTFKKWLEKYKMNKMLNEYFKNE